MLRVGQVRRHNDDIGIYIILSRVAHRACWRCLVLESELEDPSEEPGSIAMILGSWLNNKTTTSS